MQINIIAIGKITDKSLIEIYQSYYKKINYSVNLRELIVKKSFSNSKQKQIYESNKLLESTEKNSYKIALDERGKIISSVDFADIILDKQNNAINIDLLIGGADGHSKELQNNADMLLSFGRMTWPHKLARIMLIEQIYRAQTITQGHPYHK
ncbi:MAG: 23S rRNA (pseudouridine(1915)-N(3))-methyltransferase RlmH [Pseudomonadota bacterium]